MRTPRSSRTQQLRTCERRRTKRSNHGSSRRWKSRFTTKLKDPTLATNDQLLSEPLQLQRHAGADRLLMAAGGDTVITYPCNRSRECVDPCHCHYSSYFDDYLADIFLYKEWRNAFNMQCVVSSADNDGSRSLWGRSIRGGSNAPMIEVRTSKGQQRAWEFLGTARLSSHRLGGLAAIWRLFFCI